MYTMQELVKEVTLRNHGNNGLILHAKFQAQCLHGLPVTYGLHYNVISKHQFFKK